MNKKEYADILKFAIKMQIDYVEKDMENARDYGKDYEREKYCDGIIYGLRIALEKIDASEFLMEE